MNTKRLPNVSRLFLVCLAVIIVLALISVQQSAYANTPRQMEALDREVVAVQVNSGRIPVDANCILRYLQVFLVEGRFLHFFCARDDKGN